MAKKKSAKKVVEEQMPNFRVVEQQPGQDRAKAAPDAVSPSLDKLRRKYGDGAPQSAPKSTSNPGDAARVNEIENPDASDGESDDEEAQAEIVLAEPKNIDARNRGPGPKAFVVVKGKIIGSQG